MSRLKRFRRHAAMLGLPTFESPESVAVRALPRIHRVRAERVVGRLYEATGADTVNAGTRVVLVQNLDRWYAAVRYGRVYWFRFIGWIFNGVVGIFIAAIVLNELGRLWSILSA
jgi:hypothetical protein